MKVYAVVKLARPVTGQEVIDAVRKVAGDEYHEEVSVVNDDGELILVGRESSYSSRDCAVACDRSTNIDPKYTYQIVEVMNTEFPGEKYAVSESPEATTQAVRQFRDELQRELSVQKS